MSRRIMILAVALILGGGVAVGCGGGGGGGGSPFPKAVRDLFDDIDDALREGNPDLPLQLTCGGAVGNPHERRIDAQTVDVAGVDDHSGTVTRVRFESVEQRNPTTGSGTVTITIEDQNDPSRLFLELTGTFAAPSIKFLPPPIGAREFLASDGTGQVFAILTIERTVNWRRTFENDPAGMGTGTLIDFAGPPVIPMEPDGTITGKTTGKETFLVEFLVTAGPPANTACVVDIHDVGMEETTHRTSSGLSVSPIRHAYDAVADTLIGPVEAIGNRHAVIAPVGPDAVASNPVADGDAVHLANGLISGGISGFSPFLNESSVGDAGGAVVITNDGVGDPTDGDFDGAATFSIDGFFDILGGPGGLGNGPVEVSVLVVDTKQLEDPVFDDLNHPVLDEFLLYGAVQADAETGLIIYR